MHPNDYNCPFHGRFMNFLPKSLLVVLIDVLIYVFPTHFDRGLKVRLFVRHNGCKESTGARRQKGHLPASTGLSLRRVV